MSTRLSCRTPCSSSSGPVPDARLLISLALTWLLWGPRGAEARRYLPCQEILSGEAATPKRGSGAEERGYLIVQVDRTDRLGGLIRLGDRPLGYLPKSSGECAWFPLPAGLQEIHIVGDTYQDRFSLRVAPGRTYFADVQQQEIVTEAALPRFALHLIGPENDFPEVQRRSMLAEAAANKNILRIGDLSEDDSSERAHSEDTLRELLARFDGLCDPTKWGAAAVQFVVAVGRMAGGSPGASSGGKRMVRVFSTALGGAEPAAVVRDGDVVDGRVLSESMILPELIAIALRQAIDRAHGCVQISTVPQGAQVRITPIDPESKQDRAPVVIGQARLGGARQQALFVGSQDPLQYVLQVALDRHIPHREPFRLRAGERVAIEVRLQPIAPPPEPPPVVRLYRKWWFWQGIGTALAIGISGAVAAAFANDGGRN